MKALKMNGLQINSLKKQNKLVFLTCLGSTLEYYDFIIYGMMATYLSQIFFVSDNSTIAYLKTFSILSVGYLARPLGGYFFGMISDLYGRKKSLILGMSLMTSATVLMGMSPSYAQIGLWAPLILTFARVLQGLSFGAEIPSLITLIKEHHPQSNTGKLFGFIISSTNLGAVLASLMVYGITTLYSQEEILNWAWRIPFVASSILALVTLIIRNRIAETPDFLTYKDNFALHKSSKAITKEVFKNHWRHLIYGVSVTSFFSYLIIMGLYLPVYLNEYFHLPKEAIFFNMILGIALTLFTSPIFGSLFDRMNRIKVLQWVSVFFLLFLILSLQLLKSGEPQALTFFLLGYQIFISAYATNLMRLLSDFFPLPVRATSIGICYNLAYALASLLPILLTTVIHANNKDVVMLICAAGIITISIWGSRSWKI